MGQFVLNFSKKMQNNDGETQIIDSTQKQDVDSIKTQQGEENITKSLIPEAELIFSAKS